MSRHRHQLGSITAEEQALLSLRELLATHGALVSAYMALSREEQALTWAYSMLRIASTGIPSGSILTMASTDISQATHLKKSRPWLLPSSILGRSRHWYQPGAFCRVCTKAGTDISHSLSGKGAGTNISHSVSGKAYQLVSVWAGSRHSYQPFFVWNGEDTYNIRSLSWKTDGTGAGTDMSSVLSDGDQLQDHALTLDNSQDPFCKGRRHC